MSEYWDNSGHYPDLSKLPPEIRESLAKAIPMRPNETHVHAIIFRDSPGLNHPNARCVVQAQPNILNKQNPGLQIDVADFSAKISLATVFVRQKNLHEFVTSVVRQYLQLGGDMEKLTHDAAQLAPLRVAAAYMSEFDDNE